MTMNPLKPVRFYGGDLPRPRYYSNDAHERTDPPVSVNDSLLRWAADAHWSMGGLSYKRPRMMGKIEGKRWKLKNESEDDLSSPKKGGHRTKVSPGKVSPKVLSKKGSPRAMTDGDEEVMKKKNSGRIRGRHGRGVSESPLVWKKPAATPPGLGPWGEEDGPTPRRVSPRLHSATPVKSVFESSPIVSASIEFPVRRRQVERALPDVEDSDSDVNWEEFSRLKDQPVRKSSRVTSIRRIFTEFAVSDSE